MADAVDHLQGAPNYQVYFILQQQCPIRVHWRSFAVNVQIPALGFGEPKAAVSLPTQLVISYLRFTVATHHRQQTRPRQSRKRPECNREWTRIDANAKRLLGCDFWINVHSRSLAFIRG